jgi:NADPH:quinone reductase-like Zn-dependent oxidoreductase
VEYRPLNDRLLLEAPGVGSDVVELSNGTHDTKKRLVIVREPTSEAQRALAATLEICFPYPSISSTSIVSVEETALIDEMDNTIFIVLLEVDAAFLYTLHQEPFELLRKFLMIAKDVMWLNLAGGSLTGNPNFAMVNGLRRSLCNERSDLKMTTMAFHNFDTRRGISEQHLDVLTRLIMGRHVEDNTAMIDSEYLEIDGTWHVPRLTPASSLSETISLRSSKKAESLIKIKDAPPLALSVGRTGLLDTLHFVEDKFAMLPIGPEEVEVETRALGMNFKDCLVALGQLPYASMGQECAGVVTRAGTKTTFKPGDRIVLVARDSFKTFARGSCQGAFTIPDNLSFTTAVTIPGQFGTAQHCIQRLAQLKPGETVLIHSAAGGTGQALIQMAKAVGAGAIFATVSSQEKMMLIQETYGIPENHIFYSRDGAFSKGVMRITKGRGVDVVVNSLVGDALTASWECIAPNGRFVEIGRKDILSNNNLPMFPFRNNTSFHAFDGSFWLDDWPEEARRDMEDLVESFAKGRLHPPQPLRIYDISEVEMAFRVLQEGATAGKGVLEVTPESKVQATIDTRPSFRFPADATYVIAGGLGGIGRATARWMAARGAKNLILLSRGGPRGEASKTLIEELSREGVRVETPACNVTQLGSMQSVFEKLSAEMPPIKGVFQMSIVARVRLHYIRYPTSQANVVPGLSLPRP